MKFQYFLPNPHPKVVTDTGFCNPKMSNLKPGCNGVGKEFLTLTIRVIVPGHTCSSVKMIITS